MKISIHVLAQSARHQRGAALIVSLLLLVVMTILALAASQTSRLHERMAGNNRDYELAFQAAETALRASEKSLLVNDPDECPDGSTPQDCELWPKRTITAVPAESDEEWWNENTRQYGSSAQEMTGLHADPRTIAEVLGEASVGGIDIGQGHQEVRRFYKITANGFGRSSSSRVIAESVVIAQPQ